MYWLCLVPHGFLNGAKGKEKLNHPGAPAVRHNAEDELKKSGPNLFRRYPLAGFFFFAYAFNFAILGIHLYVVEIQTTWLSLLQVFTPTYSALLMASLVGGRTEIRRLLSGWTRLKVGWVWYMAAFSMLGIPLIVALIYILLGILLQVCRTGLPSGRF